MLLAVHEVMANGWVLWEEGKYASVSSQRFERVDATPAGLSVTVRGPPDEAVELIALRPRARTWSIDVSSDTDGRGSGAARASASGDDSSSRVGGGGGGGVVVAEEWTVIKVNVRVMNNGLASVDIS